MGRLVCISETTEQILMKFGIFQHGEYLIKYKE